MTKNTTHLAGEFLVAGELSRRGYPVSITMGNAKSVDIYAEDRNGVPFKVDAKAGRTKTNWPVLKGTIHADVYYIFVYMGTDDQINRCQSPEYFVVTGKEIIENSLISTWQSRQGVRYSDLNNRGYLNRWDKLQATALPQ